MTTRILPSGSAGSRRGSALRRRVLLPVLVAALTTAAASPAGLLDEDDILPFPVRESWPPPVLVAPGGTPHILFASPRNALHHAWREGGAWRDEVLDSRESWFFDLGVAVDSSGRIHCTYAAEVDDSSGTGTIMYGVREGTGWTLTEVARGVGSYLFLDPAGNPRVVYWGGTLTEMVAFDGAAWTPVDIAQEPMQSWFAVIVSLATDADGHLYILTYGPEAVYATDASGTWVETPLPSGASGGSLALDSGRRPHVLSAYYADAFNEFLLTDDWFDGTDWHLDDILSSSRHSPAGYADYLSPPVVGSDARGHMYLLYEMAFYYGRRSRDGMSTWLSYHDGTEWRTVRLAAVRDGDPVSLSAAPDGSLHALFQNLGYARHVRVALPDLAAETEGLSAAPSGTGTRVEGALLVRNLGAGGSRHARVRFYLSEDGVLDREDEPVGEALGVRALPPGGTARLPLALDLPGPLAGRRLLAVLDPRRRLDDLDRPNNTVAIDLDAIAGGAASRARSGAGR